MIDKIKHFKFLIPIAWAATLCNFNYAQSNSKTMISKINRTVDSSFVYSYQKSKFVPKGDYKLLIMGQSKERIEEYIQEFPDQPLPAGWAAYWGISEFKGLIEDFKNESGNTQNHQFLVARFPNTVIQSALWMVGHNNIAQFTGDGAYDKILKKFAKWVKSIHRPIYLRIGYEFDGQHNAIKPIDYVRAYKHIVDYLNQKGVDNIAYVWHSCAAPTFKGHPISSWYPGDDYVDWVGVSVFGQAYGGDTFGKNMDKVLAFAKAHQKPVMIAEANPIHGINTGSDDAWNQWFVPFFNFIYQKNIKAVSFINEDWQSLSITGIEKWKDGRLHNNASISEAWFLETSKPQFLKASEDLFEHLSYSHN